MSYPRSMSERCRLALVDGPLSVLFSKLSDVTVDLVTIDWESLAKRIADDLWGAPCTISDRPFAFEATALCRVPLSRYSQRL